METIFDFLTVAIFIALVGMFIQFSRHADQNIIAYLIPGLGCMAANYLGNEGYAIWAWLLIGVTLGYIGYFILRNRGVPLRDHDS